MEPDSVSAHFMLASLRSGARMPEHAEQALCQVSAAYIHGVRCSSTCLQDVGNGSGCCYLILNRDSN